MKHPLILAGILSMALLATILAENRGNAAAPADAPAIRVATFNVEDIRTEDLKNPGHPRLKRIAEIIQRLRPDIILINEIAYDQPGAPGVAEGDPPGLNGRRLADNFLGVAQSPGLQPLRFRVFMAPSNTGVSSGFDLNNNRDTTRAFPPPPGSEPDGSPGKQTPQGWAYGDDSWGFGTFPGQYGMGLLVSERFEILHSQVRTFQKFPWRAMPGALLPADPQTGAPWYSPEEITQFPLSSKSHWDVPVKLPHGAVLHLLCSHPTPPAFDGAEQRNKRRNHDEIRFWADYLNGAEYIVDDAGTSGGLEPGAAFVILGDLNADPDEGNSINNPIKRFLLSHPRVNGEFVPRAPAADEKLDIDDTAAWELRVDYVLPSRGLEVVSGGIWRQQETPPGATPVSDHFPVWIDIAVPAR